MGGYVAKRLLVGVVTLVGVTLIIFVIMRVLPGDVALVVLGGSSQETGAGRVTQEDLQRVRRQIGLDRPLAVQYSIWIRDLVTLDLGKTIWRNEKIIDIFKRRAPVSIELAIIAVALSWFVGVPLGLISALKPDSLVDSIARVASVAGLAVPNFWLGLLTIMLLVQYTGWFPPVKYMPPWESPGVNLSQMLFPALVLGVSMAAWLARMTRSSMLEVIREDYIRTARAKGLRERVVIQRHALRNALLPVITLSGIQFGALAGGSVVIETVFGLPGLGSRLIRAATERDFQVVQNFILFFALIFMIVNLAVDLSYAWLNPRIREEIQGE